MLSRGFRIFTVRGIDVRIDPSWLIIAALITWSFWGRFTSFHDRGGKVAVIMAVVGALLFFASVLVHELAHAFEAQHRGVHVGGITLFLFGGVTESAFDVKRPGDEFALTAVGPFTSFVLGAGFGLVAWFSADVGVDVVAEVAGQLGWINVALGVFNLIPGAPLDGGRILRAAVWKVTGDRHKAVRVAAQTGRFIGLGLVGLGILQLLAVPGAFVGGVWLAFIGWFLSRAARAELVRSELGRLLGDVPTRRLMSRAEAVGPEATVGDAVRHWQSTDAPEVIGVRRDGTLVGVLDVEDARRVPRERREQVRIDSVMTSVDQIPSVPADATADHALDAVAEKHMVVVTEDDRAVGLVTAERLAHAARRLHRLEIGGSFGRRDRQGVGPRR